MGSIFYLASGDAEALRLGGSDEALLTADHVVGHDMITLPHLTSLPDLAEGLPVAVDLSVVTQVWPVMPDDPESDLSWMAEPIIERISDSLRDRVAAIVPARVPALLDRWDAELNGSVGEGESGRVALDLILLARRGRDGHLSLYNRYEF